MKKLAFFFIAILIGCNETDIPVDNETDIPTDNETLYPTTIERLPDAVLSQMNSDFAKRNPDVTGTVLNQFGFCEIGLWGSSKTQGNFSEEEAITAAKEFVLRNPQNTGVNIPDDLRFTHITNSTGYGDATFWHFRTENQIVNNLEVIHSEIIFHTQNRTLISSNGNWYPDIYIPEIIKFDAEKAKSTLLGKEVFHYNIAGQRYSVGTITNEHIKRCTAKLIIVPVITSDKIKLHVTWEVRFDGPIYYLFNIDVMTGEIIREVPTIIS
jgi:hypothetical protein